MLAAAPCRVWWITMCVSIWRPSYICFLFRQNSVFCAVRAYFFNILWHTYLPTSLIHTHISTQSNACDSMNESFDKSRTNKKIIVQSQDYYDVFQQNRHSNTISVFSHKVKKKNRTQNKIHCTNKRDDTCKCVRFRLFF